MPTNVNYTVRERICTPCEHLKQTNVIHSRLHGTTCDYICMHPEAFDLKPFSEKLEGENLALAVKVHASLMEYGRAIGHNKDLQPGWCPLLREKGTV